MPIQSQDVHDLSEDPGDLTEIALSALAGAMLPILQTSGGDALKFIDFESLTDGISTLLLTSGTSAPDNADVLDDRNQFYIKTEDPVTLYVSIGSADWVQVAGGDTGGDEVSLQYAETNSSTDSDWHDTKGDDDDWIRIGIGDPATYSTGIPLTVSAGGATDLSIANRDATNLDVASSTGDDATVPAATTSLAGLMTAADKTKLGGIDDDAEENDPTNLGIANRGAETLDVTSSTGDDVTLPAATTTEAGVMTAEDKNDLQDVRDADVWVEHFESLYRNTSEFQAETETSKWTWAQSQQNPNNRVIDIETDEHHEPILNGVVNGSRIQFRDADNDILYTFTLNAVPNDPIGGRYGFVGTFDDATPDFTDDTTYRLYFSHSAEHGSAEGGVQGQYPLYIYRNAETAPSTPTGGTYTYSTKILSDTPSDWSISISTPASTERTYRSQVTVDPDTDATTFDPTWSAPIPVSALDGEPGDDAEQVGPQGRYIIRAFRNAVTQPAPPSGGGWDIDDATFDSVPSGWNGSVFSPDTGERTWRSIATIDPATQSGVVTPSWGAVSAWTGEKGDDADDVQIQYSADGSTGWGTTFTEGTHKYIRFSVDGGDTWSDGRKFVGDGGEDGDPGDDADDVQIQYSANGSTGWGTTFTAGTHEYIRFSVDGGTTWTVGFKFVGDGGGQGRYQIDVYRNLALEGGEPITPTGGTWDIADAEFDSVPTDWSADEITPNNAQRLWKSSATIDPSSQSGVVTPTWSEPVPLNGLPGNYRFYIYRNDASTPADPQGGTLDLQTLTLSVAVTGWSDSRTTPTGEERTWESYAYILPASTGEYEDRYIDLTNRWHDPIPVSVAVGDGAQGRYDIHIYRNATSAPSTPTGGTWDIADAEFDAVPSNWASSQSTPSAGERTYQATATINPDTQSGTVTPSWGAPIPLTGETGDDGDHALITLFLYRNAASTPATPTGGTYTFSTDVLSSIPSNWSQNITTPTGNNRTYRVRAEVDPNTDDTTASPTWSAPIPISALDGTDGTDGEDASITLFLYRNVEIGSTPDMPSGGTYTFSTGVLSSVPSMWSQDIDTPDEDERTWRVRSEVDPNTDDTTASPTWSEPIRISTGNALVQEGVNRRGKLLATSSALGTSVTDGNAYTVTWTLETGLHSGLTTSGSAIRHNNAYIRDNETHLGFIAVADVDGDERGMVLMLFGPSSMDDDTKQQYGHLVFGEDSSQLTLRDVEVVYQGRSNLANSPFYDIRMESNGRTLQSDSIVKIYEWVSGGSVVPVPESDDEGAAPIANDDGTVSWQAFGVPLTPESSDDGKVYTARHDGTTGSADWEDPNLPTPQAADEGEVLVANDDGTAGWADPLVNANLDIIWQAGDTLENRLGGGSSGINIDRSLITGKSFSDYSIIVAAIDRKDDAEAGLAPFWIPVGLFIELGNLGEAVFYDHRDNQFAVVRYEDDTTFRYWSANNAKGIRRIYGIQSKPTS